MKYRFLIVVLLFYWEMLPAQQSLLQLQDRLIAINADTPTAGLTDSQSMAIHRFWDIFRDTRDTEIENNRLRGRASFGFLGNSNSESEIYRINGGIHIESGSFPQDFEFSTLLNIQIDNGQLQENLSNLRISYDRFLKNKRDPFRYEGYSFINRRSDQFMGISQRYELGAGIITAFWKKKLHDRSQARYDKYHREVIQWRAKGPNAVDVTVRGYPSYTWTGIDSSAFETLHDSRERIANTIIKKRSPLRLGLLIGVFYEVESASASDELLTAGGPEMFTRNFEVTNRFRWEIRPSVNWRLSEDVYFKVAPFFKFPFPHEWKTQVGDEMLIDARLDLFADLIFSLQDNFTLSIDYNFYYDFAPASMLLNDVTGPDGQPLYLTAERRHHFVSFAVGYQFR